MTRLLLDTHVFLWLNLEPERCSPRALDLCRHPDSRLLLSVASLWEVTIKHQLGKLALQVPLPQVVADNVSRYGLELLPIQPDHVYALATLPDHHRDPFDRLIVAQALAETLTIVTADAGIARYAASTVW